MDEIIKLLKLYRLTRSLAEEVRIADIILRTIEPNLRLFVFKSIRPSEAEDVLQEVMKLITLNLKKFGGDSRVEFWGWCYRITRNRLIDKYRSQASNRLEYLPHEDLLEIADQHSGARTLSPGDRLDLEYAMNLLTAAKPECRELLMKHFILGLAYGEIAEEQGVSYDNARMKVGRCLDEARNLVA